LSGSRCRTRGRTQKSSWTWQADPEVKKRRSKQHIKEKGRYEKISVVKNKNTKKNRYKRKNNLSVLNGNNWHIRQ
jgi:hypothetical protein